MKILIVLAIFVLISGCIELTGKDCGYDKECLKNAFEKCEKAYGIWKGENGEIGVKIDGRKGNDCTVSVGIVSDKMNISYKYMTCHIPLPGNSENFSVKNDCIGELKKFFE